MKHSIPLRVVVKTSEGKNIIAELEIADGLPSYIENLGVSPRYYFYTEVKEFTQTDLFLKEQNHDNRKSKMPRL